MTAITKIPIAGIVCINCYGHYEDGKLQIKMCHEHVYMAIAADKYKGISIGCRFEGKVEHEGQS